MEETPKKEQQEENLPETDTEQTEEPQDGEEEIVDTVVVHDDGISWEAPEYHHKEKTTDWFWGIGIVSITAAVISFLLNNILFGIFIILAAFTMVMFAHRPPRMVTFTLSGKGVIVDRTLYRYKELDSFWVEEEEFPQRILFKSKKIIMPYIIVPLGDLHPEDARLFLSHYLKEVEHKEPLLQRLFEDFGL